MADISVWGTTGKMPVDLYIINSAIPKGVEVIKYHELLRRYVQTKYMFRISRSVTLWQSKKRRQTTGVGALGYRVQWVSYRGVDGIGV